MLEIWLCCWHNSSPKINPSKVSHTANLKGRNLNLVAHYNMIWRVKYQLMISVFELLHSNIEVVKACSNMCTFISKVLEEQWKHLEKKVGTFNGSIISPPKLLLIIIAKIYRLRHWLPHKETKSIDRQQCWEGQIWVTKNMGR